MTECDCDPNYTIPFIAEQTFMTAAVDSAEIIKAVDRLKKASRCVGAMALDWMIAEERAAVRSLLDLCGVDEDQP